MPRFLLNPTFDIETGKLLYHDGEFFDEPKILFDRGAVQQAKTAGKQAGSVGDTSGSNAAADRSAVIQGITQAANNPQGYGATDLNNMLVGAQEGAGGANATLSGSGRLTAIRTRNAGGFAPALDEASRQRARTLATTNLGVQNENAQLKQQQQQQARNQMLGLYGTDTSNQLKAMGIQNEDLAQQLAAGRQGWVQNVNQSLEALGSLGGGVGAAAKGLK